MATLKRWGHRALEKLGVRGRYRHPSVRGLYLQVRGADAKSWILKFERNGHHHMMGLGSWPTFNVDEAKELARKTRQLIEQGINPIEQRRLDDDARRRDVCWAVFGLGRALGWW